jgi:uncharacterized protein YjbI with pentapeptide repeats
MKHRGATIRLRLIILMVLLAGSAIPALWAFSQSPDWESFALNFSTEMAGAAVTFILLDWIVGERERRAALREEEELLRDALLGRLSSTVRDVAVNAADELRRMGWLTDGTLRESPMRLANLEQADLAQADMAGANMHRATLKGADLREANLNRADLSGAWLNEARLWKAQMAESNLWQARLHGANLRQANLQGASMNGARLPGADLRGANLQDADLTDANLTNAQFDNATILPDGTRWTPEFDLARFTDSDHPHYFGSQMA